MSRGRKHHCQRAHEKHQQKGNTTVDFDQLKVQERLQNYRPVQVPSLNTPDYFPMNFANSWMENYGSKLRKKEENFDNMYFESSKPTVEHHEYGSQASNGVKLSCMHRETVASTKWENPDLLESSSGGSGNSSSNPSSMHPRVKSIDIQWNSSRTEFGTTISGWQTCRRHCVDTLILKYVWFDTMVYPRGRCTNTL